MRLLLAAWLAATACLVAAPAALSASSAQNGSKRDAGITTLPRFGVKDIQGRHRKQTELAGRGGVVFIFCGCEPCHECARQWSQIQRGGALPSDEKGKPSRALVFFLGERDGARDFSDKTGLDRANTAVFADPAMKVARLFGAEACPRAFVTSGAGRITYTNRSSDDRPGDGKPAVLISRVVQALRDLKQVPAKPGTNPKSGTKK